MRLEPLRLYEIEWVKAANTLDNPERMEALRQIADMTRFGMLLLVREADRIRAEQRAVAKAVLSAIRAPRRIIVPGCKPQRPAGGLQSPAGAG